MSALDAGVRHPGEFLAPAQSCSAVLPVCDHYSGTEARMRKSLALQAQLSAEFGACVFDVTLDCEDGAPVGGEAEHALLVAELAQRAPEDSRVAVRVHAVDHPAFEEELRIIVGAAGARLCHVMLPKAESVHDIERLCDVLDAMGAARLPVHALIESPLAVQRAALIAAHPRVQSLSFGLMDFVSAHGGAIPGSAMGLPGQFTHPLVVRAKLEIASACHAHGKTPSHCVVTEYQDAKALRQAAGRAWQELGYTRMWSIHPEQIRPIIEAFSPPVQEIETATKIIATAAEVDWAPISFNGKLEDRASYRYHWQVLQRAHQTGRPLDPQVRSWFTASRVQTTEQHTA